MDSRVPRWMTFSLLALGLLFVGCKAAMTPLDPQEQIPDWSVYRNGAIGFYFQYPPILELEEDDRELDGTQVTVLYPGMASVVFRVDVQGATAESALRAKVIPGTEEACRVGGESGTRFQIPGREGKPETRTLVKREGWIFVFQGEGKTFKEILGAFHFGTPPPLPKE
jgi:hypothetical protein